MNSWEGFRPISSASAAALSILYTIVYVLPFYLSATTRPSPGRSRDDPAVIRARIRAVSISCFVSTASTLVVLVGWARASPAQALHRLGYWPVSIVDVASVILLITILFAGPLFEAGVVQHRWRDWIRARHLTSILRTWTGWRNFVAGPITEEVVFRAALIPLHLLTTSSSAHPQSIIFLTPLYFGIAHIHHFYESTQIYPKTPFIPALLRSLFQFAYTSLFGFFATFVFLRTASLPAVILAHAFCNWAGLPRFWGFVQVRRRPFRPRMLSSSSSSSSLATALATMTTTTAPSNPPSSTSNTNTGFTTNAGSNQPTSTSGPNDENQDMDDDDDDEIHPSYHWTVAYYLILLAGALTFWKCRWRLTESNHPLMDFSTHT